MIAIDTNVLVYAIDGSEPVKQAKAIALLETVKGHQAAINLRFPNRTPGK